MKRTAILVMSLCAALTLTACGKKGPLEPPKAQAAAAQIR